LTPVPTRSLSDAALAAGADLETAEGRRYMDAAKSKATRKAYASDWRVFTSWVATNYGADLPQPDESGRVPLSEPVDPRLVIAYLNDRGPEHTSATLARRLSAVRFHHHQAGIVSHTDHPQVSAVLAGIRNSHHYRPARATPLYLADLRAGIETLTDGMKSKRDHAVLLLGWWGAFRRSELAGITFDQITDHPEGLLVELARSKTDQAGAGRQVPIHYRSAVMLCPVRAVRAWTDAASIPEGFLFRRVDRWGNVLEAPMSGETVATIVKECAGRIGLDPDDYSAHSLRAGFVSECDRRGIPTGAVRAVTGHKSEAMLSAYSRPAKTFADSAGAYFEDGDLAR